MKTEKNGGNVDQIATIPISPETFDLAINVSQYIKHMYLTYMSK